ncbi:MAG: hypothetical protein LBD23_20345, partial [Oscillospiraceae bacterium]|nr:hypothetical protein [Oscillospiraceae bacterium]
MEKYDYFEEKVNEVVFHALKSLKKVYRPLFRGRRGDAFAENSHMTHNISVWGKDVDMTELILRVAQNAARSRLDKVV